MVIRHVPSCYNKNKLPSLISTQLVFLDKFHIKHVRRSPTTSQLNEYKFLFPSDEEGKVDVERGVNDTNNQLKRETIKYEQKGRLCIGVAKVESKYDGTITGHCCMVFDCTGKKMSIIYAYKKEIRNGL